LAFACLCDLMVVSVVSLAFDDHIAKTTKADTSDGQTPLMLPRARTT
jgi:hypothetical protein